MYLHILVLIRLQVNTGHGFLFNFLNFKKAGWGAGIGKRRIQSGTSAKESLELEAK
jgi:hypothetical protein